MIHLIMVFNFNLIGDWSIDLFIAQCLPIYQVCRKIDNTPEGASLLQRIFEGVSVYYNYTGTVECFDLDDDPHGMNGWNWQVQNCHK